MSDELLVGSEWWSHPANLEAVFWWLVHHGQMTADFDEFARFLRTPWKYNSEFESMRASDPVLRRAASVSRETQLARLA